MTKAPIKTRKTAQKAIRARLPLAFLAPRVQAAILEGRQPVDLCVARIIREDLPMGWAEQARILGIG